MTCTCDNRSDPARPASTGATGRATIPAGQPFQIRGYNANRLSITLVNETGGDLRVGWDQDQVGPTAGLLVVNGQSIDSANAGAVWVYSASGGGVSWAEDLG